MEKQPELIFPHPDIPIEECDGGLTVCHPQRGIRLKITPEERVRRHVAGWLRDLRIEPQRIVEEYPVRLNGQPQRADVVVVDPPRKGLNADTIEALARFAPRRIVYVSCDPATLARDVALLKERGYTLKNALAADLFPRCSHVESIVTLIKKENQ